MKEKELTRLSRLTAILTLLKSRRVLNASAISKKFGIGIRTVYRDVRALEQSEIPVITIDGKGYSLMEGYTIPPLMFTESEANALITAEHLLNSSKDESLISNFRNALIKMKAVFRFGIKEKTEFLSNRIIVLQSGSENKTSNTLSEIQLAITASTLVKIKYKSPKSAAITLRTIEPTAIYSAEANWILIAWCRLRRGYRAFRIDRIANIEFTESTFLSRAFDIRTYFASCPDKYFLHP